MITFQDFQASPERERAEFIARLISEHEADELTLIAREADEYDRQKNTMISRFVQTIFSASGQKMENAVASNRRRACNLFRRLNVQRCTYSLGNGVTFAQENTKKRLGEQTFDTRLKRAAYLSLIHGVSFVFLNLDQVHVFPVTEFVPLFDEYTGALRAGLRYFRVDRDKPTTATLYEEDGYTVYIAEKGKTFREAEPKRSYKRTVSAAPADDMPQIISEENYSALPIVPLWGSELHQSTLVGLKDGIDNYDLISNGWANDLTDCAQVYWILENYGGMREEDRARFRAQLLYEHIASADTSDGGKVTPYTQEIPFAARESYLNLLRRDIYADFGALDVSCISASAKTATEINAAYQPLDENADDFEYQIIDCVQKLLQLIGIEDTPQFKRNRISNQSEQVEILNIEAGMVPLDEETLLNKFPNFTPEEVQEALDRMAEASAQRVTRTPPVPPTAPQDAPEEGEEAEEDEVNA